MTVKEFNAQYAPNGIRVYALDVVSNKGGFTIFKLTQMWEGEEETMAFYDNLDTLAADMRPAVFTQELT